MSDDNNAIRIIEAQTFHVGAVSRTEQECFSVPWSEQLIFEEIDHPDSIFLCAYYHGNFAGFGTFRNICGEAHITNLAINRCYRRCGIASAIMDELILKAYENKIHELTLEVRASNREAIALYEKFGFQTLGIRRNYYTDNNEDALIMWKYQNGESQ